jgi:hypothetical protein
MEPWELVARERIRDTLARYNWSGDAFRLDELALAFCDDGVLELRGGGRYEGRVAILEFLSGGASGGTDEERRTARRQVASSTPAPTIVRHQLTNTRFLEIAPDGARVASYFTVHTDIGLDHHGRYRDDLVPVRDEWLLAHRFVSTDWRAPDSLMADPDSVG